MATHRYRVLFEQEDDGSVHAFAPELPGVHTHGATQAEALEHLEEAALAYLQDMRAEGEDLPASLEETEITITA